MPYQNLDPQQAKELLDGPDGWQYVDVRTEAEFAAGHPTGACNVPFALGTPPQMQVNPEFLAVVKANFKKDAKLVVGCASGARSARACDLLANAGYRLLVNVAGGYLGSRGPFGAQPGWSTLGLPSTTTPDARKTYDALRRNV